MSAEDGRSLMRDFIDEFIFYWWQEDALEYDYDRAIVERSLDRETRERLAKEEIPRLRASAERPNP